MSNEELTTAAQFEELAKRTGKAIAAKSFSISTADWQTLSADLNDCKYYAEIAVSGLTANDHARVDFAFDSISACEAAGVYPAGATADGKIIIYAKAIPSAAVSGVYTVQKGATA